MGLHSKEKNMAKPNIRIPGFSMVPLAEKHLDGIISLMNKEGWYYYDHHEIRRYISLDQDCFALVKNGRVAGSIFTTNFDSQAWLGNIVVAQEDRGKGLASAMIKGVTNFLHQERQVSTFRLGSVPLAIGVYKKAGFRAESFTTAQKAELPLKMMVDKIDLGAGMHLEQIRPEDLEAVIDLDASFFKSDRSGLLKRLYQDSIKPGCVCLKDRGKLVGFLMIRQRKASKTEEGFALFCYHAKADTGTG